MIAHVETCDWTVEALALQPVTEALGIEDRKAVPALYAAVEGRPPGPSAVRLDAICSAVSAPSRRLRAGSRRPGPRIAMELRGGPVR